MEESGEKPIKRPAESQVPDDDDSDEAGSSAAKRPAPGFSFRPSPLHKATQSFILRQSAFSTGDKLSTAGSASARDDTSRPSHVGFLKLDNSELHPVGVVSPTPLLGGATRRSEEQDGSSLQNHADSSGTKSNTFGGFLQSASAVPTFSSLSSITATNVTGFSGEGDRKEEAGQEEERRKSEGDSREEVRESSGEPTAGRSGLGVGAGVAMTSAAQASINLPEVQQITGEEGEKKIVQVPARLYAFDASTHSWKERGRGEIRLNDACRSEGVFQSRLVMRASGSYRVLFNTHLWAQMKCERANQKSIRITAQDRESIAVFLITGNAKDIQQLFSAVDHRIEALKLNASHSDTEPTKEKEPQSRGSRGSSPFDEEDKESCFEDAPSSPESSFESHTADIRQKAVSLPSSADDSRSDGEGEREGEGERGQMKKGEGEEGRGGAEGGGEVKVRGDKEEEEEEDNTDQEGKKAEGSQASTPAADH